MNYVFLEFALLICGGGLLLASVYTLAVLKKIKQLNDVLPNATVEEKMNYLRRM
jgi:hypothetical protein